MTINTIISHFKVYGFKKLGMLFSQKEIVSQTQSYCTEEEKPSQASSQLKSWSRDFWTTSSSAVSPENDAWCCGWPVQPRPCTSTWQKLTSLQKIFLNVQPAWNLKKMTQWSKWPNDVRLQPQAEHFHFSTSKTQTEQTYCYEICFIPCKRRTLHSFQPVPLHSHYSQTKMSSHQSLTFVLTNFPHNKKWLLVAALLPTFQTCNLLLDSGLPVS